MSDKKFFLFIITLSLVASLLAGYLIYNKFSSRIIWKNEAEVKDQKGNATSTIYFSQLTGEPVANQEEIMPRVVGVMIDNHPDAAQAGLSEAKVIYEAPVEGGLTRFFALFDKNQPVQKVGPVRSARSYYLDWLREYGDALYMHSGGSPEALDLIDALKIFDANEFYRGRFYWRDEARSAPHNLYTSSEKWQALITEYGDKRKNREWSGWEFSSTTAAVGGEPVKEIKIKFSLIHVVTWKYNAEKNYYERWVNGQQHFDESGAPIVAQNILAQYAPIQILDEEGRRQIDTIGNGQGIVLRSGVMIRGIWKKTTAVKRTRFFNDKNEEVVLVPGKVWMEVVPSGAPIDITN